MSLEQQVAALVDAANNLTGSVNGKMTQIDQKVDQATASVPDTIRTKSSQNFYIDAVSGDDSNTGIRGEEAVKTWYGGVIPKIIGAFTTRVYFAAGQTHIIEGSPGTAVTGFIEILSFGDTALGRPRIVQKYSPGNSQDGVSTAATGHMFVLRSGTCRINGCDLEADNDTGYEIRDGHGLIGRGPGSSTLALDHCFVYLNNAPLARTYAGNASISLIVRNTRVTMEPTSDEYGRLVHSGGSDNGHTIRLDADGLTFVNSDIRTQLGIKADNSNVLTNLSIPA